MTGTPLRPGSSIGSQVNRLARLFEGALRSRISPYGVVPGQFPALLALFERDGQTQRELCEVASVDQSTMAKTLARMRRDGLVDPRPDPRDGRLTRYHLTSAALDLEPELSAAGHAVIVEATKGIPAARLAAFERTLADMANNLNVIDPGRSAPTTRNPSGSRRPQTLAGEPSG